MYLNTIHEIITLNISGEFKVEIKGFEQAKAAIIFAHGFGVKCDSRGLFTDIEDLFANSMLSVRAELSMVHHSSCTALPFSIQQSRLNAISNYVKKKFDIDKLIYIGHSQGCITIGLDKPINAQILLLAPPVIAPFQAFIKTPGWKNKGSHLDLQKQSRLVRSDLIIDVRPEFWAEFNQVDAKFLYAQLNKSNKVTIIFAGADQVLGQQPSMPKIKTHTIQGADHDFTAESRKKLLHLILSTIC